jgi:ribosomal protein S20
LKDKEKSKEFYLKLQKALDKAAQKNILKKNTVSRYKSRLSQKVNAMK